MEETRTTPHFDPFDLALHAINLFLEYRDQHGHDEEAARAAAARDIADGWLAKSGSSETALVVLPKPDGTDSVDADNPANALRVPYWITSSGDKVWGWGEGVEFESEYVRSWTDAQHDATVILAACLWGQSTTCDEGDDYRAVSTGD